MKLNVEYSLEKDLWNHTRLFGSTGYSYGQIDREKQLINKLPPEIQYIFNAHETVVEKTLRLSDYLRSHYELKKKEFFDNISCLNNLWRDVGDQVIYQLEILYDKKFPFEATTAFITTSFACPYDFERRNFFVRKSYPRDQVDTIKHELNHFMFLYYFPKLENKLGHNRYQLLKESLTFFTNPEQPGYPDEDRLRKLYLSRKWKNMNGIVKAGAKLLRSS